MQVMMRPILSAILLLASAATAFVNRPPVAFQQAATKLAMFSTDDDAKPTEFVAPPLALESDATAAAAATASEDSANGSDPSKSYVRNLNTGEVMEVKWNDPAMQAHTQPWKMDWWAYILFGFPFVLLADDAFHFLPKDGPLSFLVN